MILWLTRLPRLHIASQTSCPQASNKETSPSILHHPSDLSQRPNKNVSTAYIVSTATAAATEIRNWVDSYDLEIELWITVR